VLLGVAGILLHRRMHGLGLRPVIRSYAVFLLALLPAAVVGVILDLLLGAFGTGFAVGGLAQGIVSVAVIGGVMGIVYVIALALLRAPELREFATPIVRRLRRR
jgi:putative peptidoglycan lipid II flippase